MIKRNDLVKQFELVVQQEIKNHNDSILSSNLAINEVRKRIEIEKESQNSINNALGTEIAKINTRLVEISTQVLDLKSKISSFINDQRVVNERNMAKYEDLAEAVERLFKVDEKIAESLTNHSSWIVRNHKEVSDFIKTVENNFLEFDKKHKISCENLIKQILSMPSEAQAVKAEILDKMSIDRVDFEGVMRELALVKRDNLIKEKKIEKLYILIERLEEVIKKSQGVGY